MKTALRLFRHDLGLQLRQGSDLVAPIAFFVLATIFVPLAVGPEPNLLAKLAPGIIWVTALLATLLALDRLFQRDFEDGSLDLLALSPMPLELAVLAKVTAHWATTGLPLIIVAPLLGLMMRLDAGSYAALEISLLLGTPTLSLIGAVGAAVTLGARRGGALLAILVLPLYVPVLIFATSAVGAVAEGLPARPHLLLLASMLVLGIVLAPVVAAAAIRSALE
ncbi:MAG TPA: heme exporter protein CcmB [Alphaproteobacteria bacterium]|nr:heme exporter protein CcmB [Alphaproteobacteria bacterium]